MKFLIGTGLGILAITLAGCVVTQEKLSPNRETLNSALLNTYEDDAVNNAIIVQRTLFPYHFVDNSSTMNELGYHDLKVLGEHFKRHPGPLNIRRGCVSEELYAERVAKVLSVLEEEGVKRNNIEVIDTLPAGDGLASQRVLKILKSANE